MKLTPAKLLSFKNTYEPKQDKCMMIAVIFFLVDTLFFSGASNNSNGFILNRSLQYLF